MLWLNISTVNYESSCLYSSNEFYLVFPKAWPSEIQHLRFLTFHSWVQHFFCESLRPRIVGHQHIARESWKVRAKNPKLKKKKKIETNFPRWRVEVLFFVLQRQFTGVDLIKYTFLLDSSIFILFLLLSFAITKYPQFF